MFECKDYFQDFIDLAEETSIEAYIEQMRENRVWGDDPEIAAMSEIYARPILVYSYSTEPRHKYNIASTEQPIILSYHGKCHYNAIVDKDWSLNMRLAGNTEPGVIEDRAIMMASHHHQEHMRQNEEAENE